MRVDRGKYVDKAGSDNDSGAELLNACKDKAVDCAKWQLVEYHGQENRNRASG